ncbi:MAG: hypothetical protein QE284_00600 [Rhizobium sp.]|nr:hypothetical protein [Rhizobium sp.]
MNNPILGALGTASAACYVALNATSRIVDVMVVKGLISKSEAASILISVAEQTRDDAGGSSAEEPAEELVRWLENVAKGYTQNQRD